MKEIILKIIICLSFAGSIFYYSEAMIYCGIKKSEKTFDKLISRMIGKKTFIAIM